MSELEGDRPWQDTIIKWFLALAGCSVLLLVYRHRPSILPGSSVQGLEQEFGTRASSQREPPRAQACFVSVLTEADWSTAGVASWSVCSRDQP